MVRGNLPPIEEPQAYGGFFPALWQTWVSACFRPKEFFKAVGNSQDLKPALLFGGGFGWWGAFFGTLWGTVLWLLEWEFPKDLPEDLSLLSLSLRPLFVQVGMCCCHGLFGWLVALLEILFSGLIMHLLLLLFGGANQGLTVTLRVIAYARAPAILYVVPCLGWCVGAIWMLVLEIIGLAAAHRTEAWRAVLAVFARTLFGLLILALFWQAQARAKW